VNGTWQIGLALSALLAPPGMGLLVPLLGVALRGSPAVVIALLCCALVPIQGPPPLAPARHAASGEVEAGAIALHGRWRAPPGHSPYLQTARGDVALQFIEELQPPPPGTEISVRARVDSDGDVLAVTLQATGPPRGAWIDRWAAATAARTQHLVSRDHSGIVAALLLGQRQDVPFPVTADWARLGVSHLLALSGQNVTLVVACWQRAGLGRIAFGTALLVWSFVLVAGAGAPLVRSALGFGAMSIGLRTARRSSGLRRLAVVALLMEAWEPGLHHQLSAQLSFLAVAGLIAAAGMVRPPLGLMLAPCGAFLATAPLCAETFGRVAPFGLLATPVLVPFVTVILAVGLVAILPGSLFAALDPLTGPILDTTADALLAVSAWLARVAPAPLRPPPPCLPGCLVGLAVVAAMVALSRVRRTSQSFADLVP